MSKKALELLTVDLPPEDGTTAEKPRAAQRAVALLRTEKPREFVGPPAPVEDNRPWYQKPFGAEGGEQGRMTSLKDIGRVPVAVGDAALTMATQLINKPAASLAGLAGAINPNDTYADAQRRHLEAHPLREPATDAGRQALEGADKLMRTTGIPQVAEGVGNVVRAVVGDEAADFIGSAIEVGTVGRAGRAGVGKAPDRPPTRADIGPSGEVLGRSPIDPNAPLNIHPAGGASGAAIDPGAIRSPELRAKLQEASQAGTVNPEVAQAHIAADKLGMPPLTRGQATGNPADISREQNLKGTDARLSQRYDEQNRALALKLDDIRAREAPNMVGNDPVQNGQALIDIYKTRDAAVKADIDAKYKALRDEAKKLGTEKPISGPSFSAAADAALREQMREGTLPPHLQRQLDRFKETDMSFNEFERLRTLLSEAQRSPDGSVRGAASAVRNVLEEMPLRPDIAETLKPMADAARSAFRDRMQRIELDPAYAAVVEDAAKLGETSPLSGDFVQKYVVRGKPGNVDIMRGTLGNDPVAGETITAGALNYLKSKTGIDPYTGEGNFSQAGYNRALAELTPRMRELLPAEAADDLRLLGDYARATMARPRGGFVNESNTATALLAEGAQGLADVAAASHGLPTPSMIARGAERLGLKKTEQTRYVDEALAPGAGLTSPRRMNELLTPDPKR